MHPPHKLSSILGTDGCDHPNMAICEMERSDGSRSRTDSVASDCRVALTGGQNGRNVYVCGQRMAARHGAKPIGSIKERSRLSLRRARLTDLAVVMALGGVALAVIHAELVAAMGMDKVHVLSLTLRSFGVVATVILLALIVAYHATEVKILLLDSSNQDWYVVITTRRIVRCAVELCICCICPLPVEVQAPFVRMREERAPEVVSVRLDAILTVAMFLRFYLLCRFTALRSRHYRDAATRTVASLNRIPVDFPFVLKTLMFQYPLTVLLFLWILFAVSASWIFAQCERQGVGLDHRAPGYLNSIWFTMATLMANGYGDTVPETYCGRAVAVIVSVAGTGITASLVAVMKRKLQLTRAEKRVNEFVTDTKLTVQKKHAAATILQQSWRVSKSSKNARPDQFILKIKNRQLMTSINEFRRIKFEQRMLISSSYSLCEISYIQKSLKKLLTDLQKRHAQAARVANVVSQELDRLQNVISQRQSVKQEGSGGSGQEQHWVHSIQPRARNLSVVNERRDGEVGSNETEENDW